MSVLIKRYANRKLYNTDTSRYITLKGIAALLEEGTDVRVIDNETGEDITSVALSQILVDSERGGNDAPKNLIATMMERGGDALYGALRQRINEASENIEDFQDRVRRTFVHEESGVHEEGGVRDEGGVREAEDRPRGKAPSRSESRWGSDWIGSPPDIEKLVQGAVERVFKVLDLPRRSDVASLNENLERVAAALERLEHAVGNDAPAGDDQGPRQG